MRYYASYVAMLDFEQLFQSYYNITSGMFKGVGGGGVGGGEGGQAIPFIRTV